MIWLLGKSSENSEKIISAFEYFIKRAKNSGFMQRLKKFMKA